MNKQAIKLMKLARASIVALMSKASRDSDEYRQALDVLEQISTMLREEGEIERGH